MSVTFEAATAEGRRLLPCECPDDYSSECAGCRAALNLNNRNAADLLAWLGLDPGSDLHGRVLATELAAACRRRLWDVERNHDPALDAVQLSERAVISGRPAGYLRGRTEQLLAVAERAGGAWVRWT